MPELLDEMYCSEQICIPPTFPYLLRQFAKAAIRTQPNDLLKWSTTYFRCLSLNIPPPVKTRLEYPIPKDFKGLTPGWLKTLYKQFGNTQMVTFRLLYDRWTGACLLYDDLIKILCLGKFDNNQEISVIKFLSLCAGSLTENLTKTMILICEIFTEEPDGGSAMIRKQLFLDCYQFLACQIDASEQQVLFNYQFLEKFLIDLDEIGDTDDKDEDVDKFEEFKCRCKSRSSSEITIGTDAISIVGDAQITPADYLQLVAESQATIRPLQQEEEEKDQTDTTSCSLEEEIIPNEIQQYLEKIQQINGEDDGKQPEVQQETHDEKQETIEDESEQKSYEESKETDETPEFEEIEIEAIPGIGPIIPQQLFGAVCKYFNEMAELQNGMVMPRNIRHYDCPPLEIIND